MSWIEKRRERQRKKLEASRVKAPPVPIFSEDQWDMLELYLLNRYQGSNLDQDDRARLIADSKAAVVDDLLALRPQRQNGAIESSFAVELP